MGDRKVDLYTARMAKDFDIIWYPTHEAGINPNLLKKFKKAYMECREYIMVTLYNEKLEGVYTGYRDCMGFLILAYTLMKVCIESVDAATSHTFTAHTLIYLMLSMYGIPDSILLPTSVRRNLAIHVMRLVKEKGTKAVYYDIINILEYYDVAVSKLMLMKGQMFGENGEALNDYEPYFLQVDLKDDSPYDTIASGKAPVYKYEDIISGDSSWWDDSEVRDILQTRQYSESDSKYIMLEATIHQMKYMFESIYFTRMIIDNKTTDNFMISIPDIFGNKPVSVYDCIIGIICAMCMNNGVSGEIVTDTDKLYATAGFNFDVNIESLIDYIDKSEYLEKQRIKMYISNLIIQNENDISRLFYDVLYPMREWLENKIALSENRKEYLEYEAIYRALFTYDITRNRFLDDFKMPIESIQLKYNISKDDMNALRLFYPHDGDRAVTVEEFNSKTNSSKYHYPFISLNNPIDWYIHIITETPWGLDDRGYLYFYDVLTCHDVRELTNSMGNRIYMANENAKWVITTTAELV